MTIKNTKIIIIFILLTWVALSLNSGVEAFQPPCNANAYMTKCDSVTGSVTVEYYQDENYACSVVLSQLYNPCPTMVGYTTINDSEDLKESIDYLIELLTFGFYFLIAVIVAGVFITGIKVMNS